MRLRTRLRTSVVTSLDALGSVGAVVSVSNVICLGAVAGISIVTGLITVSRIASAPSLALFFVDNIGTVVVLT